MIVSKKNAHKSLLGRLFTTLRRSRLGRIAIINRVYWAMVIRWHGSSEVKIGEFTVGFDSRDRFIATKLIVDGGYEEKEIALLCSLIKHGDVVLDVGANIGLYTLPMSRAVGMNGLVVAFEPDPDNLRLLKKNVKRNKCDNVRIVPCALGSRDGTVDLYQVDNNRGYLSFADLGQTGKSVKVPVRRGDVVLQELAVPTPSLAKIDVEGAEPLVFAGLGCRPRYLQLEFVPAQLRALGLDPMAFLESLVNSGYHLNIIDRDTGKMCPSSVEALLKMADRTQLDYNLMAILAE